MVKTTEFNIQTQMNYVVGNMSGFTAAYTGMNNLSALISSLMTSYTTMAGTGRAAYLSLGAAAAAFGLKSAEAFGEYQRGMNMVKAISNNTNAQMQMLAKSAGDFSSQFRMGIEDINSGLVTLGRAGLTDVNNQIQVLQNGLEVAKISGMDLASTLEDIVTTTSLLGGDIKSNTFGAETKEVSNLLVATSLSGPLNVSDVIETLKFAGGSAAAAGATLSNEEGLHDLLGTIGAFSQKGVTGSIAGTALRAFITKPASQDQKVSDALAKLGLDAYSLWEKDPEQGWHMKPIAEQIGMITKAMDKNHLTNLDRIEVWGDIVGNKMGQQMLKLDENRIKETTKDIEHQRNLEDIYQGTLTNFASQVERLNQVLQAIYRNLGSGFANNFTPIVKGLADFLEFINGILNGTVFKFLAAIIGPLGLAGLAKGLQDVALVVREFKQNIKESQMTPILEQDLWKGAWGVDVKQLQKIVDRERREKAYQERQRQEPGKSAEDSDEYWTRWEAHQNKRDEIYRKKLNTSDPVYNERQERHAQLRTNAYIEMMNRVEDARIASYRDLSQALTKFDNITVGATYVHVSAKNLVTESNKELYNLFKSQTHPKTKETKVATTNFGNLNDLGLPVAGVKGTFVRANAILPTEAFDKRLSSTNPLTSQAKQLIANVEGGMRAMNEVGRAVDWNKIIKPIEPGSDGHILTEMGSQAFEKVFSDTLKSIPYTAQASFGSKDLHDAFDKAAKYIWENEYGYYDNIIKDGQVIAGKESDFANAIIKRATQNLLDKYFGQLYAVSDGTINPRTGKKIGSTHSGLGYSDEQAHKYLGKNKGDTIRFYDLVTKGASFDEKAFDASMRKIQLDAGKDGDKWKIDEKQLDTIKDKNIFSALGLIGQDAGVEEQMIHLLKGVSESIFTELDASVKALEQASGKTGAEAEEIGESIVKGVQDGMNQNSPGDASKAVEAEMKYIFDFIQEWTPKITNEMFKLGESIAKSFIRGIRTNSLVSSIQNQLNTVQTLLVEQQTTLSSLMQITARDSVLNFAMGFNEPGLATIVSNEFALVLQETTLFSERFSAALFRAGFLGKEGYLMGMGIHSPGYIYVATDGEFQAVNYLLDELTYSLQGKGVKIGQALTSWTNHIADTPKKKDQQKFGEYLLSQGWINNTTVANLMNNIKEDTAKQLKENSSAMGWADNDEVFGHYMVKDKNGKYKISDERDSIPFRKQFDERSGVGARSVRPSVRKISQPIDHEVLPFEDYYNSGKKPVLVIDFETTNLKRTIPQIVQAGFTDLSYRGKDKSYAMYGKEILIDSEKDIGDPAFKTHGISNKKKKEEGYSEVAGYSKILHRIANLYDKHDQNMLLGAHNAAFDKSVLLSNLARLEPELSEKTFGKGKYTFDQMLNLIDKEIKWVDSAIYAAGKGTRGPKGQSYADQTGFDGFPLFSENGKASIKNTALGWNWLDKVKKWLGGTGTAHQAGYDTAVTAHVLEDFRTFEKLPGKGVRKVIKLWWDAWKRSVEGAFIDDGKPMDPKVQAALKKAGYQAITEEEANTTQFNRETRDLVGKGFSTAQDDNGIFATSNPAFYKNDFYGGLPTDPYKRNSMGEEEGKAIELNHEAQKHFANNNYFDEDPDAQLEATTLKKAAEFNEQFMEKLSTPLGKDLLDGIFAGFEQTRTVFLGETEAEANAMMRYIRDDVFRMLDVQYNEKTFDYLKPIQTSKGFELPLGQLGYISSALDMGAEDVIKRGKKEIRNIPYVLSRGVDLWNKVVQSSYGGADNVDIGMIGSKGALSLLDLFNRRNETVYSNSDLAYISRRSSGGYYTRKSDYSFDEEAEAGEFLPFENMTPKDKDAYGSMFGVSRAQEDFDYAERKLKEYQNDLEVIELDIENLQEHQTRMKDARATLDGEDFFVEEHSAWNWRSYIRGFDPQGDFDKAKQDYDDLLADVNAALENEFETYYDDDYLTTPEELDDLTIDPIKDMVNEQEKTYNEELNYLLKAKEDAWRERNEDYIHRNSVKNEDTEISDYETKSQYAYQPRFNNPILSYLSRMTEDKLDPKSEEVLKADRTAISKLKKKINTVIGLPLWNMDPNDPRAINLSKDALGEINPFFNYTADQLQAMGTAIEKEFLKVFPEGGVYYSGKYRGAINTTPHTVDQIPILKDIIEAFKMQTGRKYQYYTKKDDEGNLITTEPEIVEDRLDDLEATVKSDYVSEEEAQEAEEKLQTIRNRHMLNAPNGMVARGQFVKTMEHIAYQALSDADILGVDPDKLFPGIKDQGIILSKSKNRGKAITDWFKDKISKKPKEEDWTKIDNNIEDYGKYLDNYAFTPDQIKKGVAEKRIKQDIENIANAFDKGTEEIEGRIRKHHPEIAQAAEGLGYNFDKGVRTAAGIESPPRVLRELVAYIAEVPQQMKAQAGSIYAAMYEWGLSFVRGVKAGTQMASPPKVLRELITYLQSAEDATQLSVRRISQLIVSLKEEMAVNADTFIIGKEMVSQIDKQLERSDLQGNRFSSLRGALNDSKNLSETNRNRVVIKPNASNIDEQLLLLDAIRNQRSKRISAFDKQLGAGRFDNDKITEEMMKGLGLKEAAEKAGFKTKPGLNAAEYNAGIQNIYDKIDQGAYNSYNEIMLEVAQLNQARREGIMHEKEAVRLKKMENRETKYGLLGKGLNAIGTGLPNALGKGVSALGKGMNGLMSLMMNPYIMGAEMLWGFVQQAIDMWRQGEEEKIAKLSEMASNAESSYDEQTSKWEEAQSKANEKFGDLSDNEKQDQMLDAIAKAREDNNSASAETRTLIGKQNALITANNNMIQTKSDQWLTGFNGWQANYTEFMEGSGMYGTKDEYGFMDFLEGIINPDKFEDNSNTRRIEALAESSIQIDTRVKNMEEFTEDYQQVMASLGIAGRSILDIYNVRGIIDESLMSGTFFDQSPSNSMRIGAPGLMSAEKLAGLMKKQEKILTRFENRYLRFVKTSTGQGNRIGVTLGDGSIHQLANQLGVKDIEAAQMLAVHELQRIQDVMINQVAPQLSEQTLSLYNGTYDLSQQTQYDNVQTAFQNTMQQGIWAIQGQVAQLVYKATMEQALADYQAETGDTETNTIGLLLNRARDTTSEFHDAAQKYASRGWGSFLEGRDINKLINEGYTQEQAIQKLAEEKGVSVDKLTEAYAKENYDKLSEYEYNGQEEWLKRHAGQLLMLGGTIVGGAAGTALFPGGGTILGAEIGATAGTAIGGAIGAAGGAAAGSLAAGAYQGISDGLVDFTDPFTEHTNEMMKSYAASVPIDETIKTLNDAQTAADKEGDNGKDTDDSDANKQRYVQLAICNKKAIPKLNVNLFKKAPTFTVLNKNFKLRDIKINTADKAKNIENSLKNAIIDVQERSDPKIIQDSEAEYDPVGATDDATNLPTGASLTK